MPVNIRVLPENLANKIAAGEVVERPASVVKELVENSLDAGARRIFVEIQSGGIKLISVSDDGCGMGPDDALLSLERHATSKIGSVDDLSAIRTLGFRGEAIPSIASVSRMRIITSAGDGAPGTLVIIEGGKLITAKEAGTPKGTNFEVRDLFFNTPARLKFLKSRETEFSHIAAVMEKTALSHPEVHLRLTHEGREALDCPPVRNIKDRIAQVYGGGFADGLMEIGLERGTFSVSGFVSAPGQSYSDKGRQEIFLNGRPIKNSIITRAIYDAYQSMIMKDRHPATILFITMDPASVDVNVHPSKREVRFADNSEVHKIVYDSIANAFKGREAAEDTSAESTGFTPFTQGVREPRDTYVSSSEGKPDYYPTRDYSQSIPKQQNFTLPRIQTERREWKPDETRHHEAGGSSAPLQVADTYIVVPSADGYMVIDQHAAHERIQYEKVKARHGKMGHGSQGLLVPVQLDLTAKEAALMAGILPELNEIGIEAEHFGGGSFLIRSKPLFMDKVDIKEAVLGILTDIEEADIKGKVEDLREKVYQLIACKSAIKAGQRLHPEAILRLIQQLFECESPYTCAHGRPTVIKFGLGELEKMFKRK